MTLRALALLMSSAMLVIALLTPVPPSLAAPNAKNLPSLTVVDARNKEVGEATTVLNAREPLLIFLSQGVAMSFFARSTGLVGTYQWLHFTTADCTGTPYLPFDPTQALVRVTTIVNNQAYVADTSAIPTSIDTGSIFAEVAEPTGCRTTTGGYSDMVPAVAVMDMPTYTPPLRVK